MPGEAPGGAPGGAATGRSRPPRLLPALAKGVLTGIGKHPRPDAALPRTRLVLPAVRIGLGRAASYARVCGYDAAEPLPVTYPHILGFPLAARLMSTRDFPLPMLGLVHTGIEITQYAPLHPTDTLELTVFAGALRAHRRGTEVVMTTEARRGDALVWHDRSTYLARHRTAGGEGARGAGFQAAPARPRELPVRAQWRLPADLGRRHAAVSGDYNPIHLHALTARPLGFPRAIAHGMWTFARCAAEAVLPGTPSLRISAEFRAPVLLPATVSYAYETTRTGGSFQLLGGPDGRTRVHLEGRVETDV
ncbi:MULTISPECIES: MaoC/PaaZ C-terminal domain-containing protein [Streptomyces]|uniref:MaoC/PaaZ C-terminal domain-containing protein n=1 Tax=Streptomyces TaxID=1883 RepID=UPI0004CCC176|nr:MULTISPECIES: MaoC/PaaZ C-terminal domain-containing protein [Streptomyces]KOT55668.1 dehydratase [Streptomyces rimosus subsp. rimosus]